jgi:mRNA interferase RelE/StbE
VAGYSVGIKRSAAKELDELPLKDRRRVIERIRALAADPRPRACEKLSGEAKYRLRQGDLRILYEINDDLPAVTIVRIGHRRDVYRP